MVRGAVIQTHQQDTLAGVQIWVWSCARSILLYCDCKCNKQVESRKRWSCNPVSSWKKKNV